MKKSAFILLFSSIVISGCANSGINDEPPGLVKAINEEASSTCMEWAAEDDIPSRSVNKYVDECVAYLNGDRDEPAYL